MSDTTDTAAAEKAVAEAQKAKTEAEKAAFDLAQEKLKAQIPSGETKPLEGKITTNDKFGYEAELAAYNAMSKLSENIADKINAALKNKEGDAHILIVNSLDFCNTDVELLQVEGQLKLWNDKLLTQAKKIDELLEKLFPQTPPAKKEEMLEYNIETLDRVLAGPLASAAVDDVLKYAGPAATAITAAKSVLSSIADIIGYFQVDYEIKGKEITANETALRSLVAGHIKYPAYLQHFHRIPKSKNENELLPIILDFKKCIDNKLQLTVKMADLKSKVIDTNTPKPSPKPTEAETMYAESKALIDDFDKFCKDIITPPANSKYSALASAMIQQYLDHIGITHLLYLTVISMGGEGITARSLFKSGRISFLGGCVVSYVLAECEGKIVCAGTEYGSSYAKFKLGQNKPLKFDDFKVIRDGAMKLLLKWLRTILWGSEQPSDKQANSRKSK